MKCNRNLFALILFIFLINCAEKKGTQKISLTKKIIPETENNEIIAEPINTQKIDSSSLKTQHETSNSNNKVSEPFFTEGIYLNAYTVASKKFIPLLDRAKNTGLNTVIFDLKNMNGTIFFSVSQKDTILQKRIQPIINIKKVVSNIHERNLKAVSRLVMFHDQFKAKNFPEFRPQKNDSTAWTESIRRGPSWLDSSHPENQKELLDLISLVAKSGIDEIQLDYIRFPTQGNIDKAIFYFQKEDSLLAAADSSYVFREKQDIIVDFIKRAKKICTAENVRLTADIFAIVAWQRGLDIALTGQNISRMSKHLDAIHPMIYSSHFSNNFGYRQNVPNEPYHLIFKGTNLAKKYVSPNCKVIPFIQSNNWKVNFGYEYLIAQITAVKNCESEGYLLWNAQNNYDEVLDWIFEYNN